MKKEEYIESRTNCFEGATKKAIKELLDECWEFGFNNGYEHHRLYGIKEEFEDKCDKELFGEIDRLWETEYSKGEYCHKQSFSWGFQEGIDWVKKEW